MNTEILVNRFLSWQLPKTVCSDLCVTTPSAGRYGTNLLSASEAKKMIEYLLEGESKPYRSEVDENYRLRSDKDGNLFILMDDGKWERLHEMPAFTENPATQQKEIIKEGARYLFEQSGKILIRALRAHDNGKHTTGDKLEDQSEKLELAAQILAKLVIKQKCPDCEGEGKDCGRTCENCAGNKFLCI